MDSFGTWMGTLQCPFLEGTGRAKALSVPRVPPAARAEQGQGRCPSGLFEAPSQGGTGAQAGHGERWVSGQEGFKSPLGINEAFDGQGLHATVMRPRSEAELSHGIQETELKQVKELFSELCSGFPRGCHMNKDGIKGQRGRIPSEIGLGEGTMLGEDAGVRRTARCWLRWREGDRKDKKNRECVGSAE